MSKHLIQAIDVDGTKYCIKHGATTPKWRTVSFLSPSQYTDLMDLHLTTVEDADSWTLTPDVFDSSDGAVSFLTCCIWKFTVEWDVPTFDSDDAIVYGNLFLDGVLLYSLQLNDSGGETISYVVDLNDLGKMGNACGNNFLIGASARSAGGTSPIITIRITNVTFGPPV